MNRIKQHPPLISPAGWNQNEQQFVRQADNLFDDTYRLIGNLEQKIKELENRLAALEGDET
jgi:hypothetical protein